MPSGHVIDIVGQRFGRLVVLSYAGKDKYNGAIWLCRCDCGIAKSIARRQLQSGDTVSCGCYHREKVAEIGRLSKTTHGMSRSPTHVVWTHIISRCTNPKNRAWKNYGGRGIAVCDRWRNSFEAFIADMGEKPSGMTIERVDNDRGYEPENCVWLKPSLQNRNRRTTKLSLEAAAEVRKRLAGGETLDSVAAAFSVCRSTIVLVRDGRTWVE
jgi:hypothetical protein